jgi:uncharacterized membrane protein
VLIVWIAINSIILATRAFDPYPFILMNLILSCLAAIQAPIIMMSQNRAEARDRARAENDYKVNLKAELEIRHLHEKIDYLLRKQYNRLFEIQQIQIELPRGIGPKAARRHATGACQSGRAGDETLNRSNGPVITLLPPSAVAQQRNRLVRPRGPSGHWRVEPPRNSPLC